MDQVVLLDDRGRPRGTMPKALAHDLDTPLHLAFSCHVVRPDGKVLITRRSPGKRTWPGVWSNACCGHPRLGETMRQAVERHLVDELGVAPSRLAMAIEDFTYRAEMPNRIVEHELCPVVVAEIDDDPVLNADEADAFEWIDWTDLRRRAAERPGTLSPWVVEQIDRLPVPPAALYGCLEQGDGARQSRLDQPIVVWPAVRPARPGRPSTAHVLPQVDVELRRFLDVRTRELAEIDPAATDLGAAVGDLVGAGGKRLRPAFVYWGWRAGTLGAGDRADERAAFVAGAAIELLHTFALLHDDVMDRSTVRRGRPTAHVAFAGTHRARRMLGDAAAFGTSAATLAGDLVFVWADQLFDTIEAPEQCLRAARAAFTRLRTEVIAGQYLDLCAAGSDRPDDQVAMTVAMLKSARYTVTRPLQLGAALGGRRVTALDAYGDAVGLAFQMRDDVLDLFGDASCTGKGTSNDLREGKRTLLLARAWQLATDGDRAHLRRAVGDPALSVEDAERCRQIVARSGALASVEALIAARHRTALAALAGVADGASRAALAGLADLAIDRDG